MRKIKWTKDLCQVEALKYDGRYLFQLNSNAYAAAIRNGWLDDICSHMPQKIKPHNFWTKEFCRIEALKYMTLKDFTVNSSGAYKSSLKNKWLDEICSHMLHTGNRMFRCIYVYEFSDGYAYVGLTSDLNRRNVDRKIVNSDRVTEHINETGLSPILKKLSEYVLVDVASSLEKECIEIYRKNGWKMLNISIGGGVGGTIIKWTFENCLIESEKYKTLKEFYMNSNAAYKSVIKNNWSSKICSRFKN